MDRDQFFDNLFNDNGENADAIRAQRQFSFEERVIKRVFAECGIKRASWGQLVNECRNMTGHSHLTFNWFNTTYRNFPGVLCGKRIPRLHELTMLDIFKNPGKVRNRLAATVINSLHKNAIDPEHPFVFVFPVTRTMFCAHNVDIEDGEYPRVQWRATFRPMNNISVFVEPTFTFFRALGADWVS